MIILSSLLLVLLAVTGISFAQDSQAAQETSWLSQLDIYAKIFAAVLSGLGALFGLPAATLHFRKTRAEIRKLELEAEQLESNFLRQTDAVLGDQVVNIQDSDHFSVNVMTDPRFLGPLLLLLDFIIAWIVLTLSSYVLGIFLSDLFRTLLLIGLALILFVPIFREARRVKKVLSPSDIDDSEIGP